MLLLFVLASVVQSGPPPTDAAGEVKIFGGIDAVQRYPFMGHLIVNRTSTSSGFFLCGASLIDRKWVMTAGHCSIPVGSDVELNKLLFINDPSARTRKIIRRVVHPSYVGRVNGLLGDQRNDIALLELDSVVGLAPILLPTAADDAAALAVGAETTIAGFGLLFSASSSDPNFLQAIPSTLQQATIRTATTAQCAALARSDAIPFDSQTAFCAGGATGADTCSGDSGGPVFIQRGFQFVQIGITSFGKPCGGSNAFPGLYTRVLPYLGFIQDTIAGRLHIVPESLSGLNVSCKGICGQGPFASAPTCSCDPDCAKIARKNCCADVFPRCGLPGLTAGPAPSEACKTRCAASSPSAFVCGQVPAPPTSPIAGQPIGRTFNNACLANCSGVAADQVVSGACTSGFQSDSPNLCFGGCGLALSPFTAAGSSSCSCKAGCTPFSASFLRPEQQCCVDFAFTCATRSPTRAPTTAPTVAPTRVPTTAPTTKAPTTAPTTRAPTNSPTVGATGCTAALCGQPFVDAGGTCFCDDTCVSFGDCCTNYQSVCQPGCTALSCPSGAYCSSFDGNCYGVSDCPLYQDSITGQCPDTSCSTGIQNNSICCPAVCGASCGGVSGTGCEQGGRADLCCKDRIQLVGLPCAVTGPPCALAPLCTAGSCREDAYCSKTGCFGLTDCPVFNDSVTGVCPAIKGCSGNLNLCGSLTPTAEGCYCDSSCVTTNDCCSDVGVCGLGAPKANPLAVPPGGFRANSCFGVCGRFAPSRCGCDEGCDQYGDCCDDYASLCSE